MDQSLRFLVVCNSSRFYKRQAIGSRTSFLSCLVDYSSTFQRMTPEVINDPSHVSPHSAGDIKVSLGPHAGPSQESRGYRCCPQPSETHAEKQGPQSLPRRHLQRLAWGPITVFTVPETKLGDQRGRLWVVFLLPYFEYFPFGLPNASIRH